MQGSNLRHPTCKEGTLPTELIWQRIAGDGLEPTTPGVWTLWAIQLLYPAVPDARIELTASWSQTRRSTKLSQSGICSRHAAAILQVTNLQENRMLSSYAVTFIGQATPPGLEPGISAVTGLRNNQLSYEAIIYASLRFKYISANIYPHSFCNKA